HFPLCWLSGCLCARIIPRLGKLLVEVQEGKSNGPLHYRGGPLSAIQKRNLLLLCGSRRTVGVSSREDSAIGHRDRGLADAIRIRFLGANAADLDFVPNLQRVRPPALPIE